MFRYLRWPAVLILAALAVKFCFAADPVMDAAKPLSAAEEPKVISPEEAKDHEGKVVTVEFTVTDSLELADKKVGFLNSTRDQDDPNRFTAFLTAKGLQAFKEEAKIEKPAAHFKNKKIRVTGEIKLYKKKYEIEVNSPDQIKIVEEEIKAAP